MARCLKCQSLFMRANAGPIQALRGPNALNLQSLRTLLAQNQLRLATMARLQARHDPGQAAERFGWPRLPRPAGALLLGVAASGGLALIALVATGAGELVVQGVLALLAVAGAFLLFGLLFGYLRLSERVAEAEMVKAVADGLDNGLEIVNQQGVALYRNRALQRLTGRRAGRQATLEELFAGEPDSAQAFFRLNRAAERGEPRDEEFYADAGPGARAGRWLRVGVRPFAGLLEEAKEGQRLTLWQVVDVTRERTREIETVSSLEATLAFYDSLPQGLFAVTPEGRIAHVNATLSQWLRLRTEPGRTLSLL